MGLVQMNTSVLPGGEKQGQSVIGSHCFTPSHPKHHGQVPTHSAKFAICFTASTAPGSGSSSMKKFLDSQMLMAFSYMGKESSYCTGLLAYSCTCIFLHALH